MSAAVLGLVQNAALLLAMVLVYDMFTSRAWNTEWRSARQMSMGLLTGAIGMSVMLTPWQLVPGIVFDTRSVLLCISGLFFGPVPTAIAMAMTTALRLYEGGDAAWTGVLVILASGGIGIAWRRLLHGDVEAISFRQLYLLGIVVHVTMLALMLTLGWDTARRVLSTIGLPVIAIYPIATALLGSILVRRFRREQVEERLGESEERLRLALSAARQGLYDLDLRTGKATVSAEYASMLGYDPATFRETNADWIERLHPDDREAVAGAYRDYVAGKLPEYRVEFRQRTRDGGWKWVLSLGSIVERDAGGAPLRLIGTHTDITDRKAIEERIRKAEVDAKQLLAESDLARKALLSVVEDLRAAEGAIAESEAFYRGLFENMQEGFAFGRMVVDEGGLPDVVLLKINKVFSRLLDGKDVVGQRLSKVLPGIRESNPELMEVAARVVRNGGQGSVEGNVTPLGKWLDISLYCPAKDHIVAIFNDITQRKEAELEAGRRLAELEQWYQVTLGREDRVRQLKAEVNDLRLRLGERPRYRSAVPLAESGQEARK